MDYNDLCRELKRLLNDNSSEPNPHLLEWVSAAEKKLGSLKAKLENRKEGSVRTTEEEDENPNATENTNRLIKLQLEKKRLLNELSEHAGMRLTNNNPGIANLGDDNRPSKISERFSELYDNHWTDAMETLDEHKFEEKESIDLLREMLMGIYEDCVQRREKRLHTFMSLALHIDDADINSTENRELYANVKAGMDSQTDKQDDREATVMEEIKLQCLRYLSAKDAHLYQDKTLKDELHKKLQQMFKDEKRKNTLKHKPVKHYVDKCFEVCWSICLQIPQVVIEIGTYNNELYRSYTKSGDVIDYVVWPALLLYENGPVLYKGVAQMTDKEDAAALYENAQM